MYKPVVVLLLVCIYSIHAVPIAVTHVAPSNIIEGPPTPYEFTYNAPTEDGGISSREESGDGSGSVTGRYTITTPEGASRTVEYIADAFGFRASIATNEPGTESGSPAGINIESSAVPGPEAAIQAEPARLSSLNAVGVRASPVVVSHHI